MRTGVGSALLDALLAHARSQGFVRLVVNRASGASPATGGAGFAASRLLQLDFEA